MLGTVAARSSKNQATRQAYSSPGSEHLLVQYRSVQDSIYATVQNYSAFRLIQQHNFSSQGMHAAAYIQQLKRAQESWSSKSLSGTGALSELSNSVLQLTYNSDNVMSVESTRKRNGLLILERFRTAMAVVCELRSLFLDIASSLDSLLTELRNRPEADSTISDAEAYTSDIRGMYAADLSLKQAIVTAMLPSWCLSQSSCSVVGLCRPKGLTASREEDRDHLTALVSAWAASPYIRGSQLDDALMALDYLSEACSCVSASAWKPSPTRR